MKTRKILPLAFAGALLLAGAVAYADEDYHDRGDHGEHWRHEHDRGYWGDHHEWHGWWGPQGRWVPCGEPGGWCWEYR